MSLRQVKIRIEQQQRDIAAKRGKAGLAQRERERERERGRVRETERERERETDRQTDRQTESGVRENRLRAL